jgi:hypothetical protein
VEAQACLSTQIEFIDLLEHSMTAGELLLGIPKPGLVTSMASHLEICKYALFVWSLFLVD